MTSQWIISFLVFAAIVAASPRIVPGVAVKDGATAVAVAVVYGILNVLLGWLVRAFMITTALVLTVATFGLFSFLFGLVNVLVNAVLLRLTARFFTAFRLDGWVPAFVLGLLIAAAQLLLQVVFN